ncbi:unnamed protein product, partial [Porites evermanni]
ISKFLCNLNSSKKLRAKLTSPIAKSTNPGLSDTTFFARCLLLIFYFECKHGYLFWLIVFPLDDFINEVDIAIFDGGHQFLGIPVVLVILIVQSPVV